MVCIVLGTEILLGFHFLSFGVYIYSNIERLFFELDTRQQEYRVAHKFISSLSVERNSLFNTLEYLVK